MANAFKNAVNNYTFTENSALTHKTSLSACVDFFAVCGALRNRPEGEIINLFKSAYAESREIALRTLAYCRDIRKGGLGERRTYRMIARKLIDEGLLSLDAFADISVEFGSWKDVFDVCTDEEVAHIVRRELSRRIRENEKTPSFLMEKWAYSIGGKDNKRAEKLAASLNLSPKEYRKYLSKARGVNGANIPETYMCKGDWSNIVYEKNPSIANLKYANAFRKHDGERYSAYLEDVNNGKAKINASVLYPYDIVRRCRESRSSNEALDTLWNNLKDYKCDGNTVVVCDVSGSMFGTSYGNVLPIDVAVSLGIYFAERNVGEFKGQMITFSSMPEFFEINCDDSIWCKVRSTTGANWGMSTDINKVFDLLLARCRDNNVPAEEMPKRIIIVSDMEFDSCTRGRTNYEGIKRQYADAGYDMPELIFWNVNSRNNICPVTINDNGVALVSGCTPATFENIASVENLNPIKMMLETLMKPQYDYAMEIFNRQ